jgi:hypothetical protein
MKRVMIRPGKSVLVSDEALRRARSALDAFGITPDSLAKLAKYNGDVTIGPTTKAAAVKLARLARATKAKAPKAE